MKKNIYFTWLLAAAFSTISCSKPVELEEGNYPLTFDFASYKIEPSKCFLVNSDHKDITEVKGANNKKFESITKYGKEEQNKNGATVIKFEIKTDSDLSATTRDGTVHDLKYKNINNALISDNWGNSYVSYDPDKKEIYLDSFFASIAYDKNSADTFLTFKRIGVFRFGYPTFEKNIGRYFTFGVSKGDTIYAAKHRMVYCLD